MEKQVSMGPWREMKVTNNSGAVKVFMPKECSQMGLRDGVILSPGCVLGDLADLIDDT